MLEQICRRQFDWFPLTPRKEVVRPERFELPTPCFVGKCSIQLSYGRTGRTVLWDTGHGRGRTLRKSRSKSQEVQFCMLAARLSTGAQRYRCNVCHATFSEPRRTPVGADRRDLEKVAQVISFMMEGVSNRFSNTLTAQYRKSSIL